MEGLLHRAQEAGKIVVQVHDLRSWAAGKHRQADDAPYGGGDGMVMMVEPLFRAVNAVKAEAPTSPVVLLTPQGRIFGQELAEQWSTLPGLILLCGHYAGVDERLAELVVDHELSLGDYILSGGELAALVVVETVARLLPGVLGNEVSAKEDSFPGRLEYPQYTRPAEFHGKWVPEVLLSGNHEEIRRWRKKQSLLRTLQRRPDLIKKFPLDAGEREMLAELEESRNKKGGGERGGNE